MVSKICLLKKLLSSFVAQGIYTASKNVLKTVIVILDKYIFRDFVEFLHRNTNRNYVLEGKR